jgi:hypothetical protein
MYFTKKTGMLKGREEGNEKLYILGTSRPEKGRNWV